MHDRPMRGTAGQAAWLGLPIVAAAGVVLVVAGPMRPEQTVSHLALLSPPLAVLDLAAGVALIAAGSAAWLSRRIGVGLPAMLAGVAWFGSNWAGDPDVAPIARAAGMVAATLALPLLVHLVLAATQGVAGRLRWVIAALYAVTSALVVAWLAWLVPSLDPRCLELCTLEVLTAFGHHATARTLSDAWLMVTLVVAIGLAAWTGATWLRARGSDRRHRPVLVGGAAVGLAWSAWAIASLQPSGVVAPAGPVAVTVFVARAAALLVLSAGLAAWLVRSRRTIAAVQRIAERLSPFPGGGSLRSHLADALGDPGLRLLFIIPGGDDLVDGDGRMVPRPVPGSTVLPITHGGEVVALAVGSGPRADDASVTAMGPAVRLAAANDRLLAVVRHELVELQASRQRIVRAADAERHHLERGLHDGAQVAMVRLLRDLVRARDVAVAGADPAARRLVAAVAETEAAADALRLIARGIHDPVLAESGLPAALDALSVDAPIPVAFAAPAELACHPEAASAAWRVVVDAVQQAARLGGREVRGQVGVADSTLMVALEVEGIDGPLDLLPIEDRVGAGGGQVRTWWRDPSVLVLQASLPCG